MADVPDLAAPIGLILGEGEDEINFFKGLISHLGLKNIAVEEYEFKTIGRDGKVNTTKGQTAVVKTLEALRARSDFRTIRRLCVTRDMDDRHIDDLIKSIGNALRKASIPVPKQFEKFVGESESLRVGIFLFPGQSRSGALEDLCLDAIRDDLAWPCIENYFQCLDECGINRPTSPAMNSKAKIHAWLASREVADLARLGIAAQKGYLNWEHPAFLPLKTFLRELFEEPSTAHE